MKIDFFCVSVFAFWIEGNILFYWIRFVAKLTPMKYIIFLFIIFTFSFTNISAQQNHFLYFQNESKQPFYIRIDDKIFNSSSSGYLIVPKLKERDYKLVFGSSKNEWSEQSLDYYVNKDAGFLIKNFADKGWGLFDLQTLNPVMPVQQQTANSIESKTKTTETKNDNFSEMLATVVNDSTIKQKDVVIKKDEKEVLKENVADTVQPILSTIPSNTQVTEAAQTPYSVITKSLQKKNKDGMEMIYTDEYNNNKDTIRILISNEVVKAGAEEKKETIEIAKIDTNKKTQEQQETNESSTKTQPNNTSVVIADTTKKIIKEDKLEFLPATSGMPNSNCKQYATEDDFLKLRKKMAAENNNEDMIKVAKKIFKSRCFTTENIKNLSALFLNDEGRYNFFDAAYPYVSDADTFNILEKQLSDVYYIKRFQAMIHR